MRKKQSAENTKITLHITVAQHILSRCAFRDLCSSRLSLKRCAIFARNFSNFVILSPFLNGIARIDQSRGPGFLKSLRLSNLHKHTLAVNGHSRECGSNRRDWGQNGFTLLEGWAVSLRSAWSLTLSNRLEWGKLREYSSSIFTSFHLFSRDPLAVTFPTSCSDRITVVFRNNLPYS